MSQAVMLYDGMCVLCQQTLKVVRAFDWFHRVEPIDLHDWETVETRYPHLKREDLMGAIHVVAPDKTLIGFFAMRYLARSLPAFWLLVPILYLPGMNWLGPKLYGWVARRRYQINRFFGVDLCEDGFCKIG
jgi:predicted DCC family thiol-disulfide oxidoreductase YuxK